MKQYLAWKDSSENFTSFEAQKYFILTLKSIISDWNYHLETSTLPSPPPPPSEESNVAVHEEGVEV